MLVGCIVGLYLALLLSTSLPSVRERMAKEVAAVISETIGSRVEVGSMKIDLFNTATLEDVVIYDQQGDTMLCVGQAVGTVELLPLFKGNVNIANLRVFRTKATLYRPTAEGKANYQFVLDSLAPKPGAKKKMQIDLHALVLRDVELRYDVLDRSHNGQIVDLNHLDVERLNASLVLRDMRPDAFDARVRNLELKMRNGAEISRLQATASTDEKTQRLTLNIKQLAARLNGQLAVKATNSMLAFAVDNSGDKPVRRLDEAKLNSVLTIGDNSYDAFANISRNSANLARPITADISVGRLLQARVRCAEDVRESSETDFQLAVTRSEVRDILSVIGQSLPQDRLLDAIDYLNGEGHLDVNHERIVYRGTAKTSLCDFSAELDARGSSAQYKLNIASLNLPAMGEDGNKSASLSNAIVEGNVALGAGYQLFNALTAQMKATIGSVSYGDFTVASIELQSQQNSGVAEVTARVNDPKAKMDVKAFLAAGDKDDAPIHVVSIQGNGAVLDGQLAKLGNVRFAYQDGLGLPTAPRYAGLSLRQEERSLDIESDAVKGKIVSNTDFTQLLHMMRATLANHLPALASATGSYSYSNDATADFNLTLNNGDILSDYLGDSLILNKPVGMRGYVAGNGKRGSVTISAPDFTIGNSRYEGTSAFLSSSADSLSGSIMTTKYFGQIPVRIENHMSGRDDKVFSEVLWKNLRSDNTYGSLLTETQLHRTGGHHLNTTTRILPTSLFISDTSWQISPATIEYGSNALRINDLIVSRGEQFVSVNADFKDEKKDLTVQLNDVEVAYLLGLTNFKPVEFGGKASGSIRNSATNPEKEMEADFTVRDFLFNGAYLGSLRAKGMFGIDDSRLSIKAKAQATDNDSTLIDGLVMLKDKTLDFKFKSEKTNLQFLNKYVGRFAEDVEGNTTGDFHLFGTFKYVQMEADEVINYFKFRPKMLGVLYTLENQPISIRPDTIDFTGFVVRDPYGNEARVKGSVNHHYLFTFNYDIDFHLNELLTVNWKEQPSRSFWGSIFTDGDINLSGTTRDVRLTGELTSAGSDGASTLYYNSGTYGGSEESRDYIHFVDKSRNSVSTLAAKSQSHEQLPDNSGADVRMNVKFNTTPDAALNIVTDPVTRDYMSLRGNGPLQLSYYNKGRFAINGLYTVNNGSYKLTIKDIIHKNFDIQSGGYLRFYGAPSEADINLKGVHRVNSVSLSDLNVGASRSNSTVGVDCILNFTGKAAEPKVSFDIDFPKANNDENLLLKKFILTEEDRNMQAVYLLSIGRFYTYNYNDFSSSTGAQNQSTVAMTSFLAGTLSGQINNILQDAFHITNWNFGTNIAAGRMGLNDMEVQGSLSGKMFNNRLLFNGNIGYRDQMTTYSNNFVGDFNLQWLLNKAGTISLKAYSETNDRYFTKSSLSTQGGGILFQKDFRKLRDFFKK